MEVIHNIRVIFFLLHFLYLVFFLFVRCCSNSDVLKRTDRKGSRFLMFVFPKKAKILSNRTHIPDVDNHVLKSVVCLSATLFSSLKWRYRSYLESSISAFHFLDCFCIKHFKREEVQSINVQDVHGTRLKGLNFCMIYHKDNSNGPMQVEIMYLVLIYGKAN